MFEFCTILDAEGYGVEFETNIHEIKEKFFHVHLHKVLKSPTSATNRTMSTLCSL